MGWFGIGGISEDERRSIWMQHHQKNLAKEKLRAESRTAIVSYLNTELAKLFTALPSSQSIPKFDFGRIAVIQERWAQVADNGKIYYWDVGAVTQMLLEGTDEKNRHQCKMFKCAEVATLIPFSAHLARQFTQEVLPRLQTQQNSVTQELHHITQLLDDIVVLHQPHRTSALSSR